MTPGELRALEDRLCLGVDAIRTPSDAHRISEEARRRGEHPVPYRCPFGKGHWHCQPLPLATMEELAEHLRQRRCPLAATLVDC